MLKTPPAPFFRIRDGSGRHIADHIRIDKPDGEKDRLWRLPDGTWGLHGMKLSQLPLYGAEQVSTWHCDDVIVLCEGGKAASALLGAGFNALGTVNGSSGTPGPEALKVLRDRLVCLWPDNDEPGREHMKRLAAALHGVAAEVVIYNRHEAPEHGGAADHPAVLNRSSRATDRLLTDLLSAPRAKDVFPDIGKSRGNGLGALDAIDTIDAVSKDLPVAMEFPVDAMPTGCKRLVNEAATAIGCPPEFVALPMLAVCWAAR